MYVMYVMYIIYYVNYVYYIFKSIYTLDSYRYEYVQKTKKKTNVDVKLAVYRVGE